MITQGCVFVVTICDYFMCVAFYTDRVPSFIRNTECYVGNLKQVARIFCVTNGDENMASNVVPQKSTVTLSSVDGDLEVGRGAVVKGEGSPPKVMVTGTVYVEGDCVFDCNLTAENLNGEDDVSVKGDLEVRNRVNIDDGRLVVSGNMKAERVDVDKSLRVDKDFQFDDVDVGGRLEVNGSTIGRKIDVGGTFEARGEVSVESIDVGGSVRIDSKVDIRDLNVGGTVEVESGKVDRVNVGGSFVSRGALEFDDIDVGGKVKLEGKCVGGDIDVGGSCKVEGDLKFGDIDVGGVIVISGSAEGDDLDVGGKLKVGSRLLLSGSLDVGGIADVKGELVANRIDVGGKLYARKANAKSRVVVGGSIETSEGVQASYVSIGRRGKVEGPIKADEVLIKKGATVEDVYAQMITLERKAEAKNLYGERIRLESGCQITGDVKYTEKLEVASGVAFARDPQKVTQLPNFP